jgi:hypothetical protein
MSDLFDKQNIESQEFGLLLDELANDLQKFNSCKTVDFEEDNIPLNPLRETIAYVNKSWNGNPPIKFLEDLLSYYNKKKRELETNTLPTLLKSMGLTDATTKSGYKISMKPEIQFKALSLMSDEQKQNLCDWLADNGAQDLLKDTVQLEKGEFDNKLEEFLDGEGYSYEKQSGIHHQTLKSFLAKIIEGRRRGENLDLPPEDVLQIDTFDVAKIK